MRDSDGCVPTLVLCLVRLGVVSAAAMLEDHTESWAASGLGDNSLAAGHNDALSPALFSAVVEAAPRLLRESLGGDTFKFGKKNTWWMPLVDHFTGARVPPRSQFEAALHALHALDFGGARTPVIGAEWWIQELQPVAGIGFHYDKDEAYASEHMTMRFPEVSTVTYLGEVGAPTLIFNQTTPDGNLEIPLLPTEGFVVYPSPNKHLVFRGNLQHGVSGPLSRWPVGTGNVGARRTLLVNWWRYKPMAPNCVPFGAERWRRLGLLREPSILEPLLLRRGGGGGGGGGSASGGGSGGQVQVPVPVPVPVQFDWSAVALEPSSSRRLAVEIPPTDLYYFDFPAATEPGPAAADNWRLDWTPETTFGPITRLDLQHKSSTTALFRDVRPKLFFVLPTHGSEHWVGHLPKWLPQLFHEHSTRFRFALADPSRSDDFLKAFGMQPSDAPAVVLHDTNGGDVKRRMQGKVTNRAVREFLRPFLKAEPDPKQTRDEL